MDWLSFEAGPRSSLDRITRLESSTSSSKIREN